MDLPFQVIYSESVRNALINLSRKAAEKGLQQNFLSALRAIDNQLHLGPRQYGEPKFRYRPLKLEFRLAIDRPLIVHSPVHDEHPLVFVKSVRSLPGQGF